MNGDRRPAFENSNLLSFPGNQANMVKLAEDDGRTMFVCQVDENLTLDEFETSNADNDEGLSIETLGIQSVAASIVGEHECSLELRSTKQHVKLMVTSEANSRSDINVNSKFKAEIIIPAAIANDVNTNAEILIQCPNSGEPAMVGGGQQRSHFS